MTQDLPSPAAETGDVRAKECSVCKVIQPLADFIGDKRRSYGKSSRCKKCDLRKQQDYFQTEGGKKVQARLARNQYNVRREANLQRRKRNRKPSAPRDAFKDAARREMSNAIRSGHLVRPESCEACKKMGRIHGHHEDYSKPLDVIWLCVQCHMARHRKYEPISLPNKRNG